MPRIGSIQVNEVRHSYWMDSVLVVEVLGGNILLSRDPLDTKSWHMQYFPLGAVTATFYSVCSSRDFHEFLHSLPNNTLTRTQKRRRQRKAAAARA